MAASSLPTAGEKPAQEKPNVGGGGVGAGKHKSKAYNSALAIRSDAAKYRAKYKDLKKQVLAVEAENDRMHATTLRHKRNIQRMRLERAMLYEKLEAEVAATEEGALGSEAATANGHNSHSEKGEVSHRHRPRRRSSCKPGASSSPIASDEEQPRRRGASPTLPLSAVKYSTPEPELELEELLGQAKTSVRDYSSSEDESS